MRSLERTSAVTPPAAATGPAERGAPGPARDYRVPAVRRAFEILWFLARSSRPHRVSEIAAALEIGKGPCFAILKTLERSEAIVFDPEHKTYGLGAGMVRLGDAVLGRNPYLDVARPEMERLAKAIGLACFLSAPYDRRDFMIVAKAESRERVKITLDVGEHVPALGGSHGKALLAWQSPERVEELIARLGLPLHTPRSISSAEEFKRALQRTRKIGYAEGYGEFVLGVNSVAAPVFDRNGDVVLILKTLGPSEMLHRRRMAELGRLVRTAAETITAKIGGRYPG
jgi:DNA-binding IclR family transcriptional regulator